MAGSASSLSLLLMTGSERNLIKILLYTRALEVIYFMGVEKNIFPNFNNGEVIVYSLATLTILVSFAIEVELCPEDFARSF